MKRFVVYCLYKKTIACMQGYFFTWEYTAIPDSDTWQDPYEIIYPDETIFFFFCKANSEEELEARLYASGKNVPSVRINPDLYMAIVGDFYFIGYPKVEKDRQLYVYNEKNNVSTLMFPRMRYIKP